MVAKNSKRTEIVPHWLSCCKNSIEDGRCVGR
uniref:Uncharacterized protein n=1 Tax=Siphoviridae sp. ctedO8 TaxID=2827907 RepID=A0A8S5T364_9CAUD|nr:MAG TPA: hypothetical protein [Siphoviridae sp. ctedO8]